MLLTSDHRFLLRAGGYILWATAWFCYTIGWTQHPVLPGTAVIAGNLSFAAFGIAFWFASDSVRAHTRATALLLATETLIILLPMSLQASYSLCLLVIVVIWQVTLAYGWRVTAVWCAVQSLGLLVSYATYLDWAEALRLVAVAIGFQAFSMGTALVARAEAEGRQRLAQVNEELRAMQSRLSESTLQAERGRIARDLHDAVGHGLAALSLQLEVAGHVADGKGLHHVQQAKAITESLLNDIRQVIGLMRTEQIVDLQAALGKLAGMVGSTEIAITLAPDVRQGDPALNLVIFRIVQEAITNTLRHARAEKLQVSIANDAGMIVIEAKDDGRGGEEVKPGHGLSGIRERVEACGGNVFFWTQPESGFRVRAILPCVPYGAT
jgi:signal transduction histidine kinase